MHSTVGRFGLIAISGCLTAAHIGEMAAVTSQGGRIVIAPFDPAIIPAVVKAPLSLGCMPMP
jgi:hypothetical protein